MFDAIESHCRGVLREVIDEFDEHAREEDPDWTPIAPRFLDYDLWKAAGLDWQAIREEVAAEVPCEGCGRRTGGSSDLHLVGCVEEVDGV